MKYIIVNKEKASRLGIPSYGCLSNGGQMIVNEKALNVIGGNISEVDGVAYNEKEIIKIIKQGGWVI